MPRRPNGTVGQAERVKVEATLVAGFMEAFLQEDLDDPTPTPPFHHEIWRLFCSDAKYVAVAAPRGHAKSTAGTFAFGLASLLFGSDDFALIISATEALAAAHLANMARVIQENEDLRVEFGVSIVRSNETQLICRVGAREFCIIGKGAEQKVRGILWRNKRPSLILVDDLEEDEQVMNKERRDKLRAWFQNALLPCGSARLRVRMVGTVLHLDSLLERLLNSKNWVTRRFRAHKSFDDFSELLWPERWPEERLRQERENYADNPSGYSQEYLNQPIAEADAYFRKTDFRPMEDRDYKSPKTYYASIEFAIGQSEKSDNTAICIAGMDPEGMLHIIEVWAERADPVQAIERMFEYQRQYNIECWVVENENIAQAIGPFLYQEMTRRGEYMELIPIRPHKDKQRRATSIKARMRSRGVRFDFNNEWFLAFQSEMLNFPRGKNDDRVDALAWIGLLLDKLNPARSEEEAAEVEYWAEVKRANAESDGRSDVTGY